MRNNNKKKKKSKMFWIIIIIIILLTIFIINKEKIFMKFESNNIIGTWTTDGVTIYKFDNNGKGSLNTSLSKYDFSYIINDNKIYIDFENEKAIDSSFEFSIKEDTLTIKGIDETTGVYTLKKQN